MYKNVPVVTICWVTFFAICFLIFLVLSLCSESHCSCCRCLKCCREGTATVARIPSMVTTTYSSRDSLHHSLMRAGGQGLANSFASNSCGSLIQPIQNHNKNHINTNNQNQQNFCNNANPTICSNAPHNKSSEYYCWQQPYLLSQVSQPLPQQQQQQQMQPQQQQPQVRREVISLKKKPTYFWIKLIFMLSLSSIWLKSIG